MGQAQAEQSLDVEIVGTVVDPAAPDGLGDPQRVAADDPNGDAVDHVVDVADHRRRRGVERWLQLALLGRLHRAEQHRRVAEHLLHRLHRVAARRLSSDESFSAMASGSGRKAPTWRRTSEAKSSRSEVIENRAWPVSSWASTHIRISSAEMLHSSAKRSMLPGSTVRLASCRGIGRSYWPKAWVAMRPTIEPTAMPIIDGAIILLRLAIIAIIGSALRSTSSSSDGVNRLAERGGQLGEQRAVGLERALRPGTGR